jgi:hypothetical protein
MRTTRIDIEGRLGKAALFRSNINIVINVCRRHEKTGTTIRRGIGREDSWVIGCRDHAAQQGIAARLQQTLDGCRGTGGDIAEYLRAIETFAD